MGLVDIKAAIARLSEEEQAHLALWLAEFEADRFDERIEQGAAVGKLDRAIERARANYKAGRRRKL